MPCLLKNFIEKLSQNYMLNEAVILKQIDCNKSMNWFFYATVNYLNSKKCML